MPLFINALGGGHTGTQIHIPMCEPKQYQETRCAQLKALCAWFKNKTAFILSKSDVDFRKLYYI